MPATYAKTLSPEERADCQRVGALLKLAQLRVPAADVEEAVKAAFAVGPALEGSAKTILVGSLLTGIPLGIMAHMLGKKVTEVKRRERELRAKINYYRGAGKELESSMMQAGITA